MRTNQFVEKRRLIQHPTTTTKLSVQACKELLFTLAIGQPLRKITLLNGGQQYHTVLQPTSCLTPTELSDTAAVACMQSVDTRLLDGSFK
jgi:hypothetical protein